MTFLPFTDDPGIRLVKDQGLGIEVNNAVRWRFTNNGDLRSLGGTVLSADGNPLVGDGLESLGWANPVTYGALFDGITDDTAAWEAAINASAFVIAPPGRSVVNGLEIAKSVTIQGSGFPGTFLIPTTDTDCIKVNVGGVAQINNVVLRDLSIYPLTDRAAGAALHLGYVGFCSIDNVKIANPLGGRPFEGLRVDRASDCWFNNLIVAGCASNGGVLQPSSASSVIVELYFDHCEFRSNQVNGLYGLMDQVYSNGVCSLEGIHFDGCTFYNNTLAGCRVHATVAGAEVVNWHFNGSTFDSNLGTSQTAQTADGGLVVDGSFNATAQIRRLHICLQGAWSSFNGAAGLYLSKVKEFTVCCGAVRGNTKHGIDVQTGVYGRIATQILDNSRGQTDVSYGLQVGGSSSFIAIPSTFDNSDTQAQKQRGVNIGSAATDLDLANASFFNQAVGSVGIINGGTAVGNPRMKLPKGSMTAVKTTAYAVANADDVVRCDTTSAGFTVTLPRAANFPDREITAKRTAGANDVTIAATAGTVETTTATTTPVRHRSDGTNWIAL